MSRGVCVYEVDAQFRLARVDEAWTIFALENGAPNLLPPAILGTSLFDYMSDTTTAHLYEQLFLESSRRASPVTVSIRCDSPTLRRFLALQILPLQPGYRIVSTTVRTEPRHRIALLDADAPRSGEWLRMCSWCKNVESGGEWHSVEAAVAQLRLFERAELPQLTHAICEPCKLAIEQLLPRDSSGEPSGSLPTQ